MSMACVVLMAILGQAASAEDVVSQMQTQDDQIQTLEFLFHLDAVRGPDYFEDTAKIQKTETRGRLLFRAPREVRLERLSESGEMLEARVISLDGTQAKHLFVVPETGSHHGLITKVGSEFYLSSFHGISLLFRPAMLESFRLQSQIASARQWTISSAGSLLRMSLTGPRYDFHYDVNPERGYWTVAGSGTTSTSKGDVLRKETFEPVEFAPGIWIAKRAKYEQWCKGKIFYQVTATADWDSVRINQPIDGKAFEIVFPTGTVVENMLNNTTEFVGGRSSRDRKSVEELAALNNQPAPVAPSKEELDPATSALRVPETSLWNNSSIIVVVLSFLVLGGGWFSWQRWGR